MKKNVTILIGLVVFIAVLYAGNLFIKKGGSEVAKVSDVQNSISMKAVTGQVVRVFEGDNVLEYGFNIPETATTSVDMDGARINIIDGANTIATLYMSYEGARGYSPLDYIANKIAPQVSVINEGGIASIGLYDWQVAESEASEWRIASVASSSWLVIVEDKKVNHDVVEKILESVSVK